MPSFFSTSIDKCSANLPSCKSNARHYEIPEFDNDTLALKLVDNKLDQHSFICIFIIDKNHVDGNTRGLSYKLSVRLRSSLYSNVILTIE